MRSLSMGIDVGSVSTNIVIIDRNNSNALLEKHYIRTNGLPLNAVQEGFKRVEESGYLSEEITCVGVTGSARVLIGNVVGADIVKNEITAHAVAAIHQYPDVATILEIGGQDSKYIEIRNKMISDFAMNMVCAAGTGSFLDQQAFRLNIDIKDFGDYALRSKESVRIAGRCTVFAESDMIHKQQLGFSKEDIIAGLCDALVRNYLNNVAKGKEVREPILFQGGVAYNKGIVAAFERILGKKVIIPENFNVMGALGSALLAQTFVEDAGTKFRGLHISDKGISLKVKDCDDCGNACELTEVSIDNEVMATWGDKCEKWQHQKELV